MIIYKHDPSTTLSDYFAVIISTTQHLEFVDLMFQSQVIYFEPVFFFLAELHIRGQKMEAKVKCVE